MKNNPFVEIEINDFEDFKAVDSKKATLLVESSEEKDAPIHFCTMFVSILEQSSVDSVYLNLIFETNYKRKAPSQKEMLAHLDKGNLIIRLNEQENITLSPITETYKNKFDNVGTLSCCMEVIMYPIDKAVFKKICDASEIRMQLSGLNTKWVLTDLNFNDRFSISSELSLKDVAKAAYNAYYDENAYAEDIKAIEERLANREAKKAELLAQEKEENAKPKRKKKTNSFVINESKGGQEKYRTKSDSCLLQSTDNSRNKNFD